MDFERNADQQAILEAVGALLAQHAGPKRAIELNRKGFYVDSKADCSRRLADWRALSQP